MSCSVVKDSLLSDVKSKSSQAHYSEITFGSMNSSERPITLTQEDNSNISDPHQECSGESLEECFPTRPPEVKLPCRDSRSSKVCHILMTKRRRWLSQWHSRF